jgi:general secretion pathway protein D
MKRRLRLFTVILAGSWFDAQGKTPKGDQYLAEGRALEQKENVDAALELYQKAAALDPADVVYQIAFYRARGRAASAHLERGLKLRNARKLEDALAEIQKAYAIDPSSSRAEEEMRLTREMMLPESQRPPSAADVVQKQRHNISRILAPPELQPASERINLKIVSQPSRVLFETIGKSAGINVLFDPEYQSLKSLTVEIADMTAAQGFDYLALLTKSFWKVLSPNTIFVTNDNAAKRRDYEDMVTRTFYLSNVNTPPEMQEIINVVRTVAELPRVATYGSQFAIVVRGEADKVELAEKVIRDLDKPGPEVVVDVLVMQVGKTFSRQLTAAIAGTGLNVPVNFNPRSSLLTNSSSSSSSSGSTSPTISLASLGHLSSDDFSITLPNALLQAALSDADTHIFQSPQIRAVDNAKASLKVGERQPTASGSYSAGTGAASVNALVNTQFVYIDVGVNVELTPRVHDDGEVSMHIELDISSVTNYEDLGGVKEPVIGQRKVVHDIRVPEGAVSLIGGLTQDQETKTVTGIPGLSSIPLFRRLFSGESVDRSHSELMIALIPHIVRRPAVSGDNIRGIGTGTAAAVKLNYGTADAADREKK